MDRGMVDPIEYGWALCNPGVPLPAVLVRSVSRGLTLRPVGEVLEAAKVAHRDVVRRRPRPSVLDLSRRPQSGPDW